MGYQPRLRKQYQEEIVPELTKQYGYTTVMQVPKLEKISVNQGIGDALTDKKLIDTAIADMTSITGQKGHF